MANMASMDNILQKIIATTRRHEEVKWRNWELAGSPTPTGNRVPKPILPTLAQTFTLIAECKHASPSKGILRTPYHPSAIAKAYEKGGAHAISVLTEPHFFKGTLEHLRAVKEATSLPVLRKDFIIHPFQIHEAYTAGADMFLLIKRILPKKDLERLLNYGIALGLTPLIEIFDPAEGIATLASIERLAIERKVIIGINNRNLETFDVDLEQTFTTIAALKGQKGRKKYIERKEQKETDEIEKTIGLGGINLEKEPLSQLEFPIISESGIHTHRDILQLKEHGCSGALIGETLLKQDDCAQAVQKLLHSPS